MSSTIAPPTERAPLLRPSEGDASPSSHAETSINGDDGNAENASDANDKDGAQRPRLSRLRASGVLIFFSVLIFLQSTNFSVMSTTSTAVAEELAAWSDTSWFTSAYLIAMSSLSPLAGRLAQIFDPRSCAFVSGLIFALGAVLAAQAATLPAFIAGRAVQGVGAAGIYTLSVNLVLYLAPPRRRGLLIGGANAAITAGVSMGAVIGGAFVSSIGWRPLFWIQSPLALISATSLLFCIPSIHEMEGEDRRDVAKRESTRSKLASIDYVGSVLLVATLTTFLFALSHTPILPLPLLVSPILLALFILQERHVAVHPVLPITLLASRGVLLSVLAQLLFMTTRWVVLFYSPIFTQAVRLWPPATAGTVLLPTNLGFAIGGLSVGWAHIRHGQSYYKATLACLAAFPLTVLLLALLMGAASTASSPLLMPCFISLLTLNGLLAGAALNYALAHLLYITSPAQHFLSTALVATARGFAGSFGAGIGGGVFERGLLDLLRKGFRAKGLLGRRETERLMERLRGSPGLVRTLPTMEREVAVVAYAGALRQLLLGMLALAVIAVFVQAGVGRKGAKVEGRDEDGTEERREGDLRAAE